MTADEAVRRFNERFDRDWNGARLDLYVREAVEIMVKVMAEAIEEATATKDNK